MRSMRSAQPGITLAASRSSIRSSQRPPRQRASAKLPTAATSEPRWSDPVGEGAKRPSQSARAARGVLAIAVVAVAVLALAPFAAFLGFDAERGHRTRLEALDPNLFAGLEAVAV